MIYEIEEIKPSQDDAVCRIIKTVGAEFGAIGEGFGPSDSEVLAMSRFYNIESSSIYFVAIMEGKVVGGSGIAPFNSSSQICELKKLFLLPENRGFGIGKALTQKCLDFAKSVGYSKCYLDTLKNMTTAIALYEKFGFRHLEKPLGGSIHNGCDVWMIKEL